MKKWITVLLAALLLSGCASPREQSSYFPEESQRLCIYSCLDSEVSDALIQEFEARTGIWVQVETGSAAEMMARSDDGKCDLLLGCTAELMEAYSDRFLRLDGQEVPLFPNCPVGECWLPLSVRPMVLAYNSVLVRQNPPDQWKCLLAAEWKEQIAFADPLRCDDSGNTLELLLRIYGDWAPEVVLAAFASNLDVVYTDYAQVMESLLEGSKCLAVVPEDTALRCKMNGEAIALMYPEEGDLQTADCGGIPLAGSHPENARRFLKFILSEDAQKYLWENYARRPVLATLVDEENLKVSDWTTYDPREMAALWSRVWEGRE